MGHGNNLVGHAQEVHPSAYDTKDYGEIRDRVISNKLFSCQSV